MSGEKPFKDLIDLPSPVAASRSRSPRRLRNVLALSAACGVFYLGASSWNVVRRNHVVSTSPVDPLVDTSHGLQHRHKGFGLDSKKAEGIFL